MPEELVAVGSRDSVKSMNRLRVTMDKDIPVLQLIRDTTFISGAQIDSLVGFREARSQRWQRIQKLLRLNLIEQHSISLPYRGTGFSIALPGILCLEACGVGLLSLTSDSEEIADPRQIYHFLGLNQTRINLQKSFRITNWWTDRVLKSNNQIPGVKPTAKDYDSVMQIILEDKEPVLLAIEYERTMKSKERYAEIRKVIASEDVVSGVLYFAENDAAAVLLSYHVHSQKCPVAVMRTAELAARGANSAVRTVRNNNLVVIPLIEFILGLQS